MENHVKKLCHRLPMFLVGLVVWSSLFVSCKDTYIYDDQEPDWLGESVYDYLDADGNYKNFVNIIKDLNYEEVLKKTGSKTVFVANDAAFESFYKNNSWGVSNYNGFSDAQKKLILNFSVINNAYLIETLSNYYDGVLQEGSAIRRTTTVSVIDSVPLVAGNTLPNTTYWKDFRYRTGMYLLQDASGWPMVHFLQKNLDYNGISNADFKIMTGLDRERNDAHIFQNKVIERDITCKNGYIDVLESVLVPPTNIAGYIRTVPQLSMFSGFLDRYSAPYYDATNTKAYREYLAARNIPFNDSIFELRYFNKADNTNGGNTRAPDNITDIDADNQLTFDPAFNSYVGSTGSLQSDMAAVFAPTNQALNDYFFDGSGRALRERYLTWDNVPDDILSLLINRHMRESLVNSIPSNFYKMVDATSSSLGTEVSDIIDSLNYVGLNGIVYTTSKVYPPDDYVSVYGPALFSDKTTVIKWGITKKLYNLYLNSMVNSYAFVVPTDNALKYYIDPVTYGTSNPTIVKFWYDASLSAQTVKATIFRYNKLSKTRGDSVTTTTNSTFIESRIVNILDQSIVVSDFRDKPKDEGGVFKNGYYVTKDGNIIKVDNIENIDGKTASTELTFQGGNDVATGRFVHLRDSGIYHQENGTTFMVDSLVQTPFRSVYAVLGDDVNYPEFQKFFDFLVGFPSGRVFMKKTNYYGIDYNIKFFNTFRYSVYVPSNAAMQAAYDSGLIKSWDEIDAMVSGAAKDTIIDRMERFVRYHFQDNSVFVHPVQSFDGLYQTATIKKDSSASYFDTFINKFYRIKVEKNNSNTLSLTTDWLHEVDGVIEPYTANIIVDKPEYYNIMTRDYVFSLDPASIPSLTDTKYTGSSITTSSTAVIHLIDKVLRFE